MSCTYAVALPGYVLFMHMHPAGQLDSTQLNAQSPTTTLFSRYFRQGVDDSTAIQLLVIVGIAKSSMLDVRREIDVGPGGCVYAPILRSSTVRPSVGDACFTYLFRIEGDV